MNSQFYVKLHKASVKDLNHINSIFLQGGIVCVNIVRDNTARFHLSVPKEKLASKEFTLYSSYRYRLPAAEHTFLQLLRAELTKLLQFLWFTLQNYRNEYNAFGLENFPCQ